MDVLRAGKDLDAAHGVYGDPRRASAELGKLGVDAIVVADGRCDPAGGVAALTVPARRMLQLPARNRCLPRHHFRIAP